MFAHLFIVLINIVEFIVVFGIIGAIIYYSVYLTKKTTETWTVNIDTKTVLDKAIHGLSINGFVPQSKDESSVTLMREKKPSCIIGGGLLCLCAIPAIIYAIIGGSKEPLFISVKETEGRTVVTATGVKAWIMHLKKILK
jgi:hypothetical protein